MGDMEEFMTRKQLAYVEEFAEAMEAHGGCVCPYRPHSAAETDIRILLQDKSRIWHRKIRRCATEKSI